MGGGGSIGNLGVLTFCLTACVQELETFLLTMEKIKIFRGNGGKQATTEDVNAYCKTVADLPTVRWWNGFKS